MTCIFLPGIKRKYEFIHNILNFNQKILIKKNFYLHKYFNKFYIFNSNILTDFNINYNFKLIKYKKKVIYFLYNKLLNKFDIDIYSSVRKLYYFKFIIIFKKLITNCKTLKTNLKIITIYKNFIHNIFNIFCKDINKNYIKSSNSIDQKTKYKSSILLNNSNTKNNFKCKKTILTLNEDDKNALKFLETKTKNMKKNEVTNQFYSFTTSLIFGQDKGVKQIFNKLLNFNCNKSSRPIANLLFCGPSGTGKTELSKIISKYMYKTNESLIHLDMSDYKEPHSVSRLIGAAPGYVGSESDKNLITNILNKPKSVVLFDEIEKASKDIYPIFLQLLDEGILTDSKGNRGKFDKSIVIFTSNLGSDVFKNNDIEKIYNLNYENQIKESVKNYIAPEFLNRLDDIIVFNPLAIDSVCLMVKKLINDIYDNEIRKQFGNITSLISCSPVKGSRFLLNNANIIKYNTEEYENIILYNDKSIKCLTV